MFYWQNHAKFWHLNFFLSIWAKSEMKFFIILFALNCCPENGSVYFVVRTAVKAVTKRKPPKGRKKLCCTTLRPRGTKRPKGLISSFGGFQWFGAFPLRSLTQFSFGLAAMRHIFGRKWQRHRSFHYEIATSPEN